MRDPIIIIRGANNYKIVTRSSGRIASTLREACYALAMWSAFALALWAGWLA